MPSLISSSENPLLQSPWLYIQAAGSDGSDGTVPGIHLRWDLTRQLGELHIPQGDMGVPSAVGYGKMNDFVAIYRAEYNEEFGCTADLNTPPDVVQESGAERFWRYNNFTPVLSKPANKTHIIIRFKDTAQYDAIRVDIDPLTNPIGFIDKYSALIEVQVPGKLMFEISFFNVDENLQVEAISLHPGQEINSRHISNRGILLPALEENWKSIVEEQIEFVRFINDKSGITRIKVITYHDTILGYENRFEIINNFGLTTDDSIATDRLESNGTIHGKWPKYNDILGDNSFTVNTSNYLERWNPSNNNIIGQGIKSGIIQYLSLCNIDPKATVIIPDQEGVDNTISYLDLLKIASVDYHIARMLGLGSIDNTIVPGPKKFLYLAHYITERSLENPALPATINHFALSLPVKTEDRRLPPTPSALLKYGFLGNNGLEVPTNLADENGYSHYEPVRHINLYRNIFPYEMDLRPFYEVSETFSLAQETPVLQFGVEYKLLNGEFIAPELIHDQNFLDPSGIAETTCIPNNGNVFQPVFTHQETEEGVHVYALYSVNWFSRASIISPLAETDETLFPHHCRLLPPANFAAQLIQPENPPLLTTTFEQGMIGGDPEALLLRTTFEWNKLQSTQYLPASADKIQFFFRKNPPQVLFGNVLNASSMSNGRFEVNVDNMPANPGLFIGSLMVANGQSFYVVDIDSTIVVQGIRQHSILDLSGENNMFITEQWIAPSGKFVLAENMTDPTAWELQLSSEISIPGLSFNVSGGTPIIDSPGLYSFHVGALPTGSGNSGWFKGSVFMDDGSVLQVWKIDSALSEIIVFDPASVESGYAGLGSQTGVFYPGFKVYLDASVGFEATDIFPGSGENVRKSYIGARAVDTSTNCSSPICTPAVIMAQKIQAPETPSILSGSEYATRPDFYGKSSYTLDLSVNNDNGRIPYALVVYRADAQKILSTLYKQSTVEAILSDNAFKPGLDNTAFSSNWSNFVNSGVIENYPPDNTNYIIPVPDPTFKNKPFNGATTSGSIMVDMFKKPDGDTYSENIAFTDIVKQAIMSAFVPLTTQPIIYAHIKVGQGPLVTSSAPPVIKNDLGEPLSPADSLFNPTPMAIKYDGNKIRFTDYTIDGASTSFYFYYAMELSNRMEMSEPTPLFGPIQLVNTYPPEAVSIKKVTVQTSNQVLGVQAGIHFEVNKFVSAENIKKISIYRSTHPKEALSVRSMKLATTVDIVDPIIDHFNDLDFPPYGEPLFYRIVALREIVNENSELEYVASKPSNTALVSMMDTQNPPAPDLSHTETISGTTWSNVQISWGKTVHNGKYHLYKLNNYGNWVKLYTITTNDIVVGVELANTSWGTDILQKQDSNGNTIFHHFKVVAENASGLLSLQDRVMIL